MSTTWMTHSACQSCASTWFCRDSLDEGDVSEKMNVFSSVSMTQQMKRNHDLVHLCHLQVAVLELATQQYALGEARLHGLVQTTATQNQLEVGTRFDGFGTPVVLVVHGVTRSMCDVDVL